MVESNNLTDVQKEAWDALCRAWRSADNLLKLPPTVVHRRTKDTAAIGWRTHLPSDYLGRDRQLYIMLPGEFPVQLPLMYVDPNPALAWPHAEVNGRLCLWPEDQQPVDSTPKACIEEVFERFRRVFSLVIAGSDQTKRADEFAKEWTSYWWNPNHLTKQSLEPVLLLSDPPAESVLMVARFLHTAQFGAQGVERRKKSLIVCDHEERTLVSWLNNADVQSSVTGGAKALYLPLHTAPNKPGAPATIADIESFIEAWAIDPATSLSKFHQLLAQISTVAGWLIFAHDESALAGLRLTPKHVKPRTPGRQNRKTREHARQQQRRVGFDIDVVNVQRADPAWFQERGLNTRHRRLSSHHVTVVGAGSLGSMAAEGLAMTGVGRLTLIDPGILESANIGRHALGMMTIDQTKVFGLRARLLADYPHLEVEAVDKKVQAVADRLSQMENDIVVCTSANPEAETFLIKQLDQGNISSLLLAWCEPHALAGHSAHSSGAPYMLQTLFQQGRCIEAATQWPESQTVPLPGCGASHIPGAGNRIRLIAAHIVEHAIDVLVGNYGRGEHRIWVSASQVVESFGGKRLIPPESGEATMIRYTVPVDASLSARDVAI